MADSTWKSVVCLIGLAAVMASMACSSAPSVEETPVASWREEAEYLALPGERRFFLLPLNNPGVVPASAASHMEPDDLVFGLVVNGQPRAYPRWLMVAYHVVNDTINNVPVMVAHCEACSGSAAFNPVLDGFGDKALTFQIYGEAAGTFNVYDYQTRTIWSPFTGRTTEGQMHPTKMSRVPLVLEPWKDWAQRYPETDVVLASRLMIETREHGRGVHSELGDDFVAPVFAPTANMEDTRLPYGTLIFGITNAQGDQAAVFPLEFLDTQEGLLEYSLTGQEYLIRKISEFSVVAFRLSPEQQQTSFHIVSENPFRLGDDDGGVWDEFGSSVGTTGDRPDLETADGYFTEWYEWVSSFPQSEIAGS
ncbi:MAG: DUF3179 domain-containing (seleno)protein [Acidobacteriota bacterium]